ncbi:hypothetical protein E4O86_11450 [Rhizobiales bacterium L72]|uniref:Aminoglycoside phosphotransferase domain-containing protein n=2 Tax=Propylenella binzhouense TaxID=2555902 RepID=A0A964T4R2_9HYPH|nr:hypothetical protein [Propylenella binzhouense]
MSWVFLGRRSVLKIKKPLKTPFLDFSTVERREANCREEVRLNRRLAGEVYRDVVPIVRRASGELALGGRGTTVDWVVRMKRLPAGAMLDAALRSGRASRTRIEALGDRLVAFYRGAERPEIDRDLPWRVMAREMDENRRILGDPRLDADVPARIKVLADLDALLARSRGVLAERVDRGEIVDGHGDLRPEHVWLFNPPLVIDCLEFNPSLRLVDPFDETTFLGLECARLGAPWVDGVLRARMTAGLGRVPSPELLRLYRAFRATLRARLALAHLLEPSPRTPQKWEPAARAYLALAEAALRGDYPPAGR